MVADDHRPTFDTDPSRYRHWRLACDGPIATLTLDVAEDGGLVPGYRLKLNSYDLGVDIELRDALDRIRFGLLRCDIRAWRAADRRNTGRPERGCGQTPRRTSLSRKGMGTSQ